MDEHTASRSPHRIIALTQTPGSDPREQVVRQFQICNACRYCEGLCAVFPALERRRRFTVADIDALANLCHHCGACHYDCQYAPPHPFAVNVPPALAAVRERSYAEYAWPRLAGTVFERQALFMALAVALAVAAMLVGFALAADDGALFAADAGPGAFYRVMPHEVMVALFGSAFGFAILAIGVSLGRFWRAIRPASVHARHWWSAVHDGLRLRNLEGGGMGCATREDERDDPRRRLHHLTAGGFLLCFLATSTATVMHYAFDWPAPYEWWTPPVVLGTLGGLGIVLGPIGLLRVRAGRDPRLVHDDPLGAALLWMLALIGITGLALLGLRATAAMQTLLAIHLGLVFAWFLLLPYGKFVHGPFRLLALVRDAAEREAESSATVPTRHPTGAGANEARPGPGAGQRAA
jgi:citrate/tricarballylate utilization protein